MQLSTSVTGRRISNAQTAASPVRWTRELRFVPVVQQRGGLPLRLRDFSTPSTTWGVPKPRKHARRYGLY
ncbi:MAG: hypothetical protein R2822_03720 [Spirosomataceae bacterium]